LNAYFIVGAIIAAVAVAWWTVKSEKGATSFFLSALQGIAAMFAVNLAGLATGVTLSVNWYTLTSSAVLGLPGVIGMLTLNFIFGT